ncbi:MAG: N-acetyltransferase [Planctomycetota bacterium]
MSADAPQLRRARVDDVPAIGAIINDAAEFGLMLPKSYAQLYENVREFVVAVDGQDRVVGTCGLSIIWADLAEVVSLAVSVEHRGKGLGRKLVEAVLEEARELKIRRVMSLTYEQAFFEKLGFAVVDRAQLPMKVWADCVRCPKNEACDEIAMIREFEDITPSPEAPPPTAPASVEPPVMLTNLTTGQS